MKHADNNSESSNLSLKRKANEEVLEISSTGYGFESVLKETTAEPTAEPTEQQTKDNCGGL